MADHTVTFFTLYPFEVGQKIRIEGSNRQGDWEIIGLDDQKVKLRCHLLFWLINIGSEMSLWLLVLFNLTLAFRCLINPFTPLPPYPPQAVQIPRASYPEKGPFQLKLP